MIALCGGDSIERTLKPGAASRTATSIAPDSKKDSSLDKVKHTYIVVIIPSHPHTHVPVNLRCIPCQLPRVSVCLICHCTVMFSLCTCLIPLAARSCWISRVRRLSLPCPSRQWTGTVSAKTPLCPIFIVLNGCGARCTAHSALRRCAAVVLMCSPCMHVMNQASFLIIVIICVLFSHFCWGVCAIMAAYKDKEGLEEDLAGATKEG